MNFAILSHFSIFRSRHLTKMVRYSRLAVGAAAALAFCSALPGKLSVERVMSTARLALLVDLFAAKSIGRVIRLDLQIFVHPVRHLLLLVLSHIIHPSTLHRPFHLHS